jgi:hypothetical protein
MKTAKARVRPATLQYDAFSTLDGRHPWSADVPEGLIAYPVRRVPGGRVSYFNYDLAREMGLISADHPRHLTPELTEVLLDTFCLRIVNEYDQQNGARFAKTSLKPHAYMATRYLQMQHPDKTGRTSGDGRAIWNGVVKNGAQTWDVSSRGTGVTMLSPGAVKAGQPLKSGSTEFGYGCGLAEIDELYGQAIAAEIFHRNAIPTERVLAIIDLGRGVGIGVRAAPNLLRPAHLFLYLKQNKAEPLVRGVDYLIKRQHDNGAWSVKPTDPDRYAKVLREITRAYARFVAKLDRDYVFAWLEWDGDNVLADAGIIDYGSIRQFGLRHDQYRYDDVERFSTNLNEQRRKARDIVQTFAQMFDFARTGVRKPWRAFDRHPALAEFEREFKNGCLEYFLGQCGFTKPVARVLLTRHRRDVEALFTAHEELERVKTYRQAHKVADGIHRPAILNMRQALAKLPAALATAPVDGVPPVRAREFFNWIIAESASTRDRRLSPKLARKLEHYQLLYVRVVRRVSGPATWTRTLGVIRARAERWNNPHRMTGNALINIVDQILRHRRGGLNAAEIQAAIEGLIDAQTFDPDYRPADQPTPKGERHLTLLQNIFTTIDGFREDI